MTVTLSRHGNSLALVLQKAILELLGINAQTKLAITTNGKSLVITPVDEQSEAFETARKSVMADHHQLFKRLADR